MGSLAAAAIAQASEDTSDISDIRVWGYRIVNTYPHDPSAFTQGLAWEDGALFESTGRYGSSSLRRVDLESGRVIQQVNLSDWLFGEGIALWRDQIVQLTWRSGLGLVWCKSNLTQIGGFSYKTEGWGLTTDGNRLIMSDGSPILHLLDPDTFQELGELTVTAGGVPLQGLNELEFINGEIFANIWPTSWIAIISPQTGSVQGIVDLGGILVGEEAKGADVLNGIAYDSQGKRILVTGKLWPKLFWIELVEETGKKWLIKDGTSSQKEG